MTKKRLLALLLSLCLAVSLLPVGARAEEVPAEAEDSAVLMADEGKCGRNVNWSLDDGGTLEISGSGYMYSWSDADSVPWAASRSSITSVVVADGVENIGGYAFSGCTKLTGVSLPNSILEIDGNAFNGCTGLTRFDFSARLTSIAGYAFKGCTGLTQIDFPAGLTTIGNDAFNGCTGLKELDLPAGLTSVGDSAFSGCTGLTELDLSGDSFTMGTSVFSRCTSLQMVTLPAGLKNIPNSTFSSCSGLLDISIPSSVTSVGYSAFNGCNSLSDVYFGGTEDEWNQVSIDNSYGNNNALTNARKHFSTTPTPSNPTAVAGVTLNMNVASVKVGKTLTLTATISPGTAADKSVTWTSSDTGVVAVNNGVVTGVSEGTATITVTTNDGGKTALCNVRVNPSEAGGTETSVTSITLNKTSLRLSTGSSATLTATVSPSSAANKTLLWSVADESIASVEGGKVTALSPGVTTVTVYNSDSTVSAECQVTVTQAITSKAVTALSVTGPANTTNIKGSALDVNGLMVTATYEDSTSSPVTAYAISGYNANKLGEQTITVSYGGKSAAFVVTVVDKAFTGIAVTRQPTKTVYTWGEDLNTSGLVVTASYNDGTSAAVTGYELSGYDRNKAGSQTVRVTYGDFSTSFTVTVSEKAVTGEVAKPALSIASFPGGKTVALSTATARAAIYYTTDGSVPTSASAPYREPIRLTDTTTIKAVAILNGSSSAVVSGAIAVSQVSAPEISPGSGDVADNTVVTLRTGTSGATIFYTLDGSEPSPDSDRSLKYTGSILLSSKAAVNGKIVLKTLAVKDGFKTSAISSAVFTLSQTEVSTDEVTVSLGSVKAAAGDIASVPVYLFTGEETRITGFQLLFTFDERQFENAVTITPAAGVDASRLFANTNGGSVNLLYNGDRALQSGEVCTLNFSTLASLPAGTRCEIKIDLAGSSVTTSVPVSLSGDGTVIELEAARIAQLSGQASFTGSDGKDIRNANDIKAGAEIEASLTLDDVDEESLGKETIANLFLALYNRHGMMIRVESWMVDLSDPAFAFIQKINIPQNVEVGAIKIMVLSDQMVPLMAASELAK